ncbi:hypothetical protein AQI88_35410 [Streptomyces cellostaticus]|uniref:Uncharacterized protein n=1 Tax=Streptomyces cellostaticus TaxID=67285 RepID=A0A101NEM6_9ACTN|nr:hypothetical protein AQI88_35410 [Streptomyces cellostaticus]GHI04183.1 hypothetical protein Scel_25040 [Streptomyces cellostaticus]
MRARAQRLEPGRGADRGAGTGWRSVFLVNVPVVLIGPFLAVRFVPESRSQRPEPFGRPGTVVLALSLLTLLAPLTEGGAESWSLVTVAGAVRIAALGLVLWRRRRKAAVSS